MIINTKFNIGDKVLFQDKEYIIDRIDIEQDEIYYALRKEENKGKLFYQIVEEKHLMLSKSFLLTQKEKDYLFNLLKPYDKSKIENITKRDVNNKYGYLAIRFYDEEKNFYPTIEKYKFSKLEYDKKYTLKELGL